MPAMTKRVNIQTVTAVRTISPPISGSYRNVIMSTGDILKCLCRRAKVEEILPDGSTVKLNMSNYYLDNGAGLDAHAAIKKEAAAARKAANAAKKATAKNSDEKAPEAPKSEEETPKTEAPVVETTSNNEHINVSETSVIETAEDLNTEEESAPEQADTNVEGDTLSVEAQSTEATADVVANVDNEADNTTESTAEEVAASASTSNTAKKSTSKKKR